LHLVCQDKSHNLLSNSTCSSSKSMENLRSLQRQGSTLVEHQPRKARSLHNSAVSQFQWKQCINRPSKLDLAKHTEDAGIVRRLESPAAISLLSPRPFNRQNSGSSQVRMVPPLDFSSLNSLSSSSQSYEVTNSNSNSRFAFYSATNFSTWRQCLPHNNTTITSCCKMHRVICLRAISF
jgi:hypothetical protein